MNESNTPRDRLQAWFDNPETPTDAWKTLTFKEIETQAGVSTYSIQRYLPSIVGVRHPEITGYAAFRQARRDTAIQSRKKGESIGDESIAKIQELRATKTIHETAEITGFSISTIQRYSTKKYRGKSKSTIR